MPEALNKLQAKAFIVEAFDIAQCTDMVISDPPKESDSFPDQMQFCHMRIEASIPKMAKDQLLRDLTKVHNSTDDINKLVIQVSSPGEDDRQKVTVHAGKLKAS